MSKKAKISELSNGIKVVTQSLKGFKTTTIGAFVRVGSRNETKELNGISHFFEHMAFKGTKNRSYQDIAYAIESIGGSSNAYTSHEMTVYYNKVLSEYTELSLDIISDSLKNSLFSDEELNKERGVILQEINRSLDDPMGVAFENFYQLAFNEHPLGRDILGPPENIKNFTRDNFVDYLSKHYGANRMVVSAAGDVEHNKFVDMAEKYFGDIKKSDEYSIAKPKYVGGFKHFNKAFEQSNIVLGYPSVSFYDKDRMVAGILSQYLGGGMSSPLFDEIREKRGLAYAVGAGGQLHEDSGLFYIYGGTTKENISEFLKCAIEEVVKITKNVDEKQLNRAKTQYKVSVVNSVESSATTMRVNGGEVTYRDKVFNINKSIKKIEKVTADDLKRIATKILKAKPTLSLVGTVDDLDYYGIVNNKK